VERVEDDGEPIAGAGVVVFLDVADDKASRFVVFGENPEMQGIVVVKDTDLGVERRRLSFARIVLHEIVCYRGIMPGCFVG
jgi:hypothetical protein